MDEVKAVEIHPLDDFVEMSETAVDLLKIRYKKKGIEMDDLQAWQYIAWCNSSALGAIRQYDQRIAGLVDYITGTVAETCARVFRQKTSGILEPPSGPRFDSPEHFTQVTTTPPAPATTQNSHHHQGYL